MVEWAHISREDGVACLPDFQLFLSNIISDSKKYTLEACCLKIGGRLDLQKRFVPNQKSYLSRSGLRIWTYLSLCVATLGYLLLDMHRSFTEWYGVIFTNRPCQYSANRSGLYLELANAFFWIFQNFQVLPLVQKFENFKQRKRLCTSESLAKHWSWLSSS